MSKKSKKREAVEVTVQAQENSNIHDSIPVWESTGLAASLGKNQLAAAWANREVIEKEYHETQAIIMRGLCAVDRGSDESWIHPVLRSIIGKYVETKSEPKPVTLADFSPGKDSPEWGLKAISNAEYIHGMTVASAVEEEKMLRDLLASRQRRQNLFKTILGFCAGSYQDSPKKNLDTSPRFAPLWSEVI